METNKEITDLFEKYEKLAKNPVAAAILTQTQFEMENVVVPPPDEIEDDPEFMSVDEAARLIKCHQSTIYRLVNSGKLRASRFGRNKRGIRIARAAVDEYLDDAPPDDNPPIEKACWR